MKNSGFFATSSSRVKQSLNKNGLSSRSWERYLTVSVTRLGDLLGIFLKPVAIFVKVLKSFIFLVKSFLANFYRHWWFLMVTLLTVLL